MAEKPPNRPENAFQGELARPPDRVLNFVKWKDLILPVVYGWRRNEYNYLYIGQSSVGLRRILTHDIINVEEEFLEKDELVLWFTTIEELNKLEQFLIKKHQPKYNIVHTDKTRRQLLEQRIKKVTDLEIKKILVNELESLTNCKHCNKEFVPDREWQEFCNNKCRNDFHNAQRKNEPIKCPYCNCNPEMIELISNVSKQYLCNSCSRTFVVST